MSLFKGFVSFFTPFCKPAAAKSLQSLLTLCDPIDGSPPGSATPGILQRRTLEWVAISFSSAWKWKMKVKSLSCVQLLATPWTAAYQAPLSMGFSRQECWSGLPFPSPGDLPDPGIEPRSPALQADALPSEPPGQFWTLSSSFLFPSFSSLILSPQSRTTVTCFRGMRLPSWCVWFL